MLRFFTFSIFIWFATFVYIDGDPKGRAKKSSHIGGFAKWMWKGQGLKVQKNRVGTLWG